MSLHLFDIQLEGAILLDFAIAMTHVPFVNVGMACEILRLNNRGVTDNRDSDN